MEGQGELRDFLVTSTSQGTNGLDYGAMQSNHSRERSVQFLIRKKKPCVQLKHRKKLNTNHRDKQKGFFVRNYWFLMFRDAMRHSTRLVPCWTGPRPQSTTARRTTSAACWRACSCASSASAGTFQRWVIGQINIWHWDSHTRL
jgi:hypothetical protein